ETRIVDTDIGRIGMYACMDGLVPETTRVLTLKGAQILINTLASNGLDEAHTHIPARAVENHVWVIASNRCGPIVDEADRPALEQMTGISYEKLMGGGESQVVSPTGEILARAKLRVDDMVYAVIDAGAANDKSLPDGGDMLRDRRPELYGLIAIANENVPW